MIQTVIFDMDGVIIDSEPIYFKIEKQMFEELNIIVSFEEHCTYVGTSSHNMWQTITGKHGLSIRPEELVKKERDLYLEYLLNESNLHPIDGVAAIIEALHKNNFKLLIASSSHIDVIDAVLRRLYLSDFFMTKISGADLQHSKPHPEIFLRSAKLVHSEPEECLVIEDSENGVTAAKEAGMKCIGFLNLNSGIQDLSKADIVIRSFRELDIDIIKSA